MFIYNIKQNPEASSNHILDPDYSYNNHSQSQILYPYFKNIIIPNQVDSLIGIYMKYQITDIQYQKNPRPYILSSPYIEKIIKKHLDFGWANLYNFNSDHFFLTMFNTDKEYLLSALIKVYNEIQNKQFIHNDKQYCYQIKYGIFFSDPEIHPYQLYDNCQHAFLDTLHHPNRFISFYSHSSFD